jgi:hypothetical protein
MFLLYHSKGCNICEMILHKYYINDLHTTTCSDMLDHLKRYCRFAIKSLFPPSRLHIQAAWLSGLNVTIKGLTVALRVLPHRSFNNGFALSKCALTLISISLLVTLYFALSKNYKSSRVLKGRLLFISVYQRRIFHFYRAQNKTHFVLKIYTPVDYIILNNLMYFQFP